MFSPSLISVMFHTLHDPETPFSLPRSFTSTVEIADLFSKFASWKDWSHKTVPVVARTGRQETELKEYFSTIRKDAPNFFFQNGEPYSFFWGRIPLQQLIKYFLRFHDEKEEFEYLDIGSPMVPLGSRSPYDQTIGKLMRLTPARNAAVVGAAIIDMGNHVKGSQPDNYGGMLRHVVTTDIEMSDHAEKVLSILLEQLDSNSQLKGTTVSCALVCPPVNFIGTGLSEFDQACSPEMLTALNALEPHLTADGLPVAVNMSLGTHVGPHNGDSPLEQYISGTLVKKDRYLFAAAGNDGGAGRSAKCTLEKDEPEYLTLRTGPLCEQLLVELWWEDTGSLGISIDVDIWETVFANKAGTRTNHATLRIDPTTLGTLSLAPAGLPSSMRMHSLFSTSCQNNLRCAAFAISAANNSALPVLDINLRLEAANLQRKAVVNGWIVLAEADPLTAATTFVEGGAEGNVTVPASDPTVLSVSGLDVTGKVWKGSSRGPAAEYDTINPNRNSPLMAHRSHLGSEFGTSFASPRACGDAIEALANPNRRANCSDALSLLKETYGIRKFPQWNPRFGYHKA